MEAPTDSALWERMRRGDLDAWGEVFDRHAPQVSRFCSRYLGDADEAEDALSETFLEVWRSRKSFVVREETAAPILLAIARRACQKRLRAAERRGRRQERALPGSPRATEDVADAVVERSEAAQRREWLHDRVRELPAAFRDVFELIVCAELSYRDAARLLGVSEGTVKSRMSRLRRLLEGSAETVTTGDQGVGPDQPARPVVVAAD